MRLFGNLLWEGRQGQCVAVGEVMKNFRQARVRGTVLPFDTVWSSLSHSWPWRTRCTPCPCSSSPTRSSRHSRSSWASRASSPSWKRWTRRSSPSSRSSCRASESTGLWLPPLRSQPGNPPAICERLLRHEESLCVKQAKTTLFYYKMQWLNVNPA